MNLSQPLAAHLPKASFVAALVSAAFSPESLAQTYTAAEALERATAIAAELEQAVDLQRRTLAVASSVAVGTGRS